MQRHLQEHLKKKNPSTEDSEHAPQQGNSFQAQEKQGSLTVAGGWFWGWFLGLLCSWMSAQVSSEAAPSTGSVPGVCWNG